MYVGVLLGLPLATLFVCAHADTEFETLLEAAHDGDSAVISGILSKHKDGELAGDAYWKTAETTPLHIAARNEQAEAFFLLWPEFKTLGKRFDNESNSVIHHAVIAESLAMARFILKQDLSYVNLKDNARGETPLDDASSPEMIDLLVEHGANLFSRTVLSGYLPIHSQAFYGYTKNVQHLLGIYKFKSVDEPRTIAHNRTLLHCSAGFGNRSDETARLLIGLGADPYARTNVAANESMPIHIAAYTGNTKLVKYLIGEHPDMATIRNAAGLTPLDLAINHLPGVPPEYHAETIAFLKSVNPKA